MRYAFTTLACAAFVATSLAAPVLDGRAQKFRIITEYTTFTTTQTIVATAVPESTAAVEVESYNSRKSRPHRPNSSTSVSSIQPIETNVPAPEPTTVVPEPIVIIETTQIPEATTTTTIETTAPEPTTFAPEPETTTIVPEPETTTIVPEPETTTIVPEPETTTIAPEPETPTTTTATAPSPTASADDSVKGQALAAHNNKRALHGAPNLVWDDTMAEFAKGVSSTCVFKHSGGPYGENLAAGYPSVAAAIEAWYDEESQYNYSAGQFSSATGHFTQVVWKSATKIGCALVPCNNQTPGSFLTCNYDTGNVIGHFVENVLPPISS